MNQLATSGPQKRTDESGEASGESGTSPHGHFAMKPQPVPTQSGAAESPQAILFIEPAGDSPAHPVGIVVYGASGKPQMELAERVTSRSWEQVILVTPRQRNPHHDLLVEALGDVDVCSLEDARIWQDHLDEDRYQVLTA